MLSLICFLTGPYHATLYCDYERIYFDKKFINEKKYIYFLYLIPCFNCVQLVWKGLNDFDGRQWILRLFVYQPWLDSVWYLTDPV